MSSSAISTLSRIRGVDNPLYDEEENTHAVLVLGDAKDSLREISEAYREACKGLEDTYRAGDTAVEDAPEKMLTPVEQSGRLLANAKKIIIVRVTAWRSRRHNLRSNS